MLDQTISVWDEARAITHAAGQTAGGLAVRDSAEIIRLGGEEAPLAEIVDSVETIPGCYRIYLDWR
jgi:hypothetical protein